MVSLDEQVDAVREHTDGLADAAANNLGAPVEHCPGWSVRDLVLHVIDVHASWGQVVERRLSDREQFVQPPPPQGDLIAALRSGAAHFAEVLRGADPDEHVWTWSRQQDVAFVARHQVQEAAVHRWDAEHAAGTEFDVGPRVAADAVEEFLTFSVPTAGAGQPGPGPALPAPLVLAATDCAASWTVLPGEPPGTVHVEAGQRAGAAHVTGTAWQLLLWLYRRVDLPVDGPSAEQAASTFRELADTD